MSTETITSYELLCRFAELKRWRVHLSARPRTLRHNGKGLLPTPEDSHLTHLAVFKAETPVALAESPIGTTAEPRPGLEAAADSCLSQLEAIGEPWREATTEGPLSRRRRRQGG